MSPTRLFDVYVTVVKRREYTRESRGSGVGIAIDSDMYALRWQRLDRLAKKLEVRLLADLEWHQMYVNYW